MRIAFYSTQPWDRRHFSEQPPAHAITWLEGPLTVLSASLAADHDAVCVFVNDDVSGPVVHALADVGIRLILLRSAGFNHVDLDAARQRGLTVARVPAYSPHAVAEHTVALILALNRHIPRAHARVRDMNFSLRGLEGFDLHGRTVGVVGTGKIGGVFAGIMRGFGCRVLAHDPYPNDALGLDYVSLEDLLDRSDIVSLHLPLTPDTHHLIGDPALARMKPGAMLVNTSRGALIDTRAVVGALKRGHLGYLAIDVYEEEEALFFRDLSDQVIQDDVFARLQTFPNVLITAHQAFFTRDALDAIARVTLDNATAFESGLGTLHTV